MFPGQTIPVLLAMLSGSSTVLPTVPYAAGRDSGRAGSLKILAERDSQQLQKQQCQSAFWSCAAPWLFPFNTLEEGRAGEVGAVNQH